MKYFIGLVIFLLPFITLAGGTHPPRPVRGPGPPPGLPIDQNLILLGVIAITLILIYKRPIKISK